MDKIDPISNIDIIEKGLLKYKEALKILLVIQMEELLINYTHFTGNNNKTNLEVWGEAIKNCINIVKES